MTYSSLAGTFPAVSRPLAITPAISIPKLSQKVLYITLSCLMVLLYLVQVTQIDANGYKQNDYQVTMAKLQAEHDSLALQSAQLQSVDRAGQYAADTGMVAVTPR